VSRVRIDTQVVRSLDTTVLSRKSEAPESDPSDKGKMADVTTSMA